MSNLIKWFEKRRETKAIATIQRHLTITTGIVEDVEKALKAAVAEDEKQKQEYIRRVAASEGEADALRRRVMDEVSKGELAPDDRSDIMDLVKKVDMVADWSRESTRILNALPMKQVPASIKEEFLVIIDSVKTCTVSLQKCINKMINKPDEALQAADAVEREEERVDEIHERGRKLLAKEDMPRAGVAVLISQLFEAIEMIADSCEDACDEVRVIMIRK